MTGEAWTCKVCGCPGEGMVGAQFGHPDIDRLGGFYPVHEECYWQVLPQVMSR